MASSFTVKAKYQSQTRKFAFQGSYSFPTFSDLKNELSRVFPQLEAFYISRLIFVPQPDRQILIGMAVHNEADWNLRVASFIGGVFPGAMLKLTVEDEAVRKHVSFRRLTASTASTATHAQDLTVFRNGPGSSSASPVPHIAPPFVPPPPMPFPPQFCMSGIPPPPIIFSTPPQQPQPMDVDFNTAVPIPPPPPIIIQSPPSAHCCQTESKKQEVKELLSDFLRDFDRLTTSTFGASTASLASESGAATPRSEAQTEAPPQKPPKPWQTQGLPSRNDSAEYLAVPGSFASVSARQVDVHDTRGFQRSQSPTPSVSNAIHRGIWCDSCKKILVGVRHKCMKCKDFDLCTPCMEKPGVLDAHSPTHVFFDIPTPDTPVHRGIVCDSCEKTIVGSRHKCLDCPDFDMCTPCMDRTRLADMGHNPFHEFYEIKEPGRVVVHTVHNGEGDRQPTRQRPAPVSRERSETVTAARVLPLTPPSPPVHSATCDLCDSRIVGDRYKCLACPDFDVCKSCFIITEEQHPGHGFVRITDPDALVLRDTVRASDERHYAWCNQCKKTVFGVRYKCMHPSCPDFDLCQDCEAHPIDVHPPNHPLLKMKTADTVIPTVYRVGGTTLIPDTQQPVPIPSRLPTPQFEQAEASTSSVAHGVPTPFQQAEMTGASYVPWYISESPEIPQQPELTDVVPPVNAVTSVPAPVVEAIAEPLMTNCYNSPATLSTASNTLSHLIVPVSMPPPTVPDAALDFGIDLTSQFSHLLRPTPSTQSEKSLIDFDHKAEEHSAHAAFNTFLQSLVKSPVENVEPASVATPISSPPLVERTKTLSPLTQEPLLSTPFTKPMEVLPTNDFNKHVEESKLTSLAPMLQWLSTASASKVSSEAPVSAPLAMPGAMPEDLFTTQLGNPTFSPLTTPSAPLESAPAAIEEVKVMTPPTFMPRGLNAPPAPAPLRASYEADLNIPDGQVFPPGAEFVKSWIINNDGERCWPETVELRFVAGERMSLENTIVIGAVPAGSKATISTPEMKAPEVPGRYMSYWRLFESKDGSSFGSSIWVDITVAEPSSEETSDSSLSASSVIMPHASGPSQPSVSIAAPTVISRGVASSATVSDDGVSIASSMSLIDVNSDDSDEEAWQETRSAPTPSRGELEYVVLYESTSEDESGI